MAFTTDAGAAVDHRLDRLGPLRPVLQRRWSAGRCGPTGDTGNFTVATDVEGCKTHVVITALDKDDEFLNFQSMTGTVIGPDMESIPLEIEQTAPGRYVGEVRLARLRQLPDPGHAGAGQAMIRTGVNVGYSDEFRDREDQLAAAGVAGQAARPRAASRGKLMEPLPRCRRRRRASRWPIYWRSTPIAETCPWRSPARTCGHGWCSCASCLFLADVFVRRVQVGFDGWVRCGCGLRDVVRGASTRRPWETMSRLQSRKAEVDQSLDSRRAARAVRAGRRWTVARGTTRQPMPVKRHRRLKAADSRRSRSAKKQRKTPTRRGC